MASLWAFRFLLFYIVVLCVQPQNRFTFLYPLHIADMCIMGTIALHFMSFSQEGKSLIRMGPATITALLLMFFAFLSNNVGVWQTSSSWNPNMDIIFKNSLVLILVEAMAFNVQRVWAVQTTLMLSTLWWVKGGLRLAVSGQTYSGDRLMGPAVSLIENPNGFAYLLTVMIPLYLYFYQKSNRWYLRYAFMVVTLCSVYIVLQTGSRTGLVALIAVAAFLLPKYAVKYKFGLLVGGGIIFLLVGLIDPGNIARFKTIPQSARDFLYGADENADPESMTQDQQSSWERKMKNKHTWKLIKDYPVFGVGVNASDDFVWEKYPFASGQVHNEILYAGKQMGFIGISLYLALVYNVVQGGRRSQKAAKGWWPAVEDLGWTFKMQGVVFLAGGFFSPISWNPLYLIIAGSASALVANLREGAFSREVPNAKPTNL